jgi:hypothetical protein
LLVIIALAAFWYGVVPVAGAFITRRRWRIFRRRFDKLRLKPALDYGAYRQEGGDASYRFIGGFESLTGGETLWLQGEGLTVPVSLGGAHIYMLPSPRPESARGAKGGVSPPPERPVPEEGEGKGGLEVFDPGEEAPERIRWDRISALATGAKVFVGGPLIFRDGRRTFSATRENPLLVIFYDGPDRSFPVRTIRAARHRNEYWNAFTPYGFILGAFSQLIVALVFLPRPAFLLTALTALIALFTPVFPLAPPGLLFTVIYRRLWWRARLFRARRDLARLPLKYIPPGERTGRVPGGELYGAVYVPALPPEFFDRKIPVLIPGQGPGRNYSQEGWYIFGALSPALAERAASLDPARSPPLSPPEGECPPAELPAEPEDVFALHCAVPGNPEILAARYTRQAYVLEILAWVILLSGMGLNVFFIHMIVALLF